MVKQKEILDKEIDTIINQNKNNIKKDKWALKYHMMPNAGWINDPNGLCYFNGYYHVFYQYSPLDVKGGLKFWGHCKSKDCINWKDDGIALYPDKEFDRSGVYSGSAIVKDGEMYLFYTGNVKEEGEHDYINTGRQQNVVVVKTKDGINFSEKHLVLTNDDFPKEFTLHVRDPKVFKDGEFYYMVLGARGKDDLGYIVLYKSHDLIEWELNSIPAGGMEKLGYMWECPDFIKVNNKDALLISPQGIKAEGYLYNNVYQSGYMIGEFTKDKKKFNCGDFIELDRGFDFYAPQTFYDDKGRCILIGWMGLPDIEDHYSNPTIKNGWQHTLTMPRELSIKNNKIIQKPIDEIKELRQQHAQYKDVITEEKTYKQLLNKNFELKIEIKKLQGDFNLNLEDLCNLEYDSKIKVFKICLEESGFGRKERAVSINKLSDIHIFGDSSCLEIFLNLGDEVFTTRVYPIKTNKDMRINCNAEIVLDVWKL